MPAAAGDSSDGFNSRGRRGRLFSGGIWNLADFVTGTLFALPLTVLLVRVLPRHQFGDLAVAVAISALLSIVAALGLTDAVSQRMAHTSESSIGSEVLATARWAAIVMGLVGVVSLCGTSVALNAVSHTAGVVPALLALAPVVLLAPVQAVVVGALRVAYVPVASLTGNVTASIVLFAGSVGALALGVRTALPIALLRSGSMVIGLLVTLWVARSQQWLGPVRRRGSWQLARLGLVIMSTSLAAIFISQFDVMVVGIVKGSGEAGLYSPVSRLFDLVLGAFAALGAYVVVTLTAAANESPGALARDYHWCAKWVLVLLAPLLACLIVAPGPVLHLLFGTDVGRQISVARILAVATAIHVSMGYNGLVLVTLGDRKFILFQGIAATCVSAVAAIVLVPPFGLIGAAIATAVALTVSNAICSFALAIRHGLAPADRSAALTFLAFLSTTSLALAVRHHVGADWHAAVFGAVVAGAGTLTVALRAGDAPRWQSGRVMEP